MKSFIAGVVLGFAASCGIVLASSPEIHDGMFWNQLTRAAKDGYVNGYADAMLVSVSRLDTLTTAGDLFNWKGSRKIIHQVEAQLSISELPPEDVINRLDALYRNKKYVELDLSSALQLMALRPQPSSHATSSNK